MNCPVCKIPLKNTDQLEPQLTARICTQCNGHWVNSYQYWKWRDTQKGVISDIPPGEKSIAVKDTNNAKICPECNRLLFSSKVGHGLKFSLDRCAFCGGLWFDSNEWEALKQAGLHLDAHTIFTKVWQQEIRKQEIKEDYERSYAQRFGEDAYKEIKRIRNWIQNNPKKEDLLRYLIDDDPYSI
jgi:Zn-finger nucleic acid-binding protein